MSLMVVLKPALGPALVVGGGAVAARKVEGLLAAGFTVTVVAPAIAASIASSGATLVERTYQRADLADHALVFACTNDRAVNCSVGEAAREAGLPVNVADAPGESTFFSVATHRDGDIQVGVSTAASGPRLAAHIRDDIAASLSPRWAAQVADARRQRERPSR